MPVRDKSLVSDRSSDHQPSSQTLAQLCAGLEQLADQLDERGDWPHEQLELCAQHGVFRWFVPEPWGGEAWSDAEIFRAYLDMAAACLTTTFVLTQRAGACRRISLCEDDQLKARWLPPLATGECSATVGISHLTTSRRHLAQPVLRAEVSGADYLFDGFSPWVTGAAQADIIVLGATLDDGRQLLAAVPTDEPGVSVSPPAKLLGLSASHTGPVVCDRVRVPKEFLLAGPRENVMQQGQGGNTGGLQTSTLALGLSLAAVRFLEQQGQQRPELTPPAERLRADWRDLTRDMLAATDGSADCSPADIRQRANSLVLRASQAALGAAKGAGFVGGHPAGRWCRESLFFLVWSCPQPVMNANLCELAGIATNDD